MDASLSSLESIWNALLASVTEVFEASQEKSKERFHLALETFFSRMKQYQSQCDKVQEILDLSKQKLLVSSFVDETHISPLGLNPEFDPNFNRTNFEKIKKSIQIIVNDFNISKMNNGDHL